MTDPQRTELTVVEASTKPVIESKDIDFGKYIPLASAGLIFLGVSKLINYYSFFGVNILSFLEFGEIITSFLDVVVATTFILATSWISYLPAPVIPDPVKVDGVETKESKKKRNTSLIINIVLMIFSAYWVGTHIWELISKNWKLAMITVVVFGIGGLMVYGLYRLQKRFTINPIRSLIILSMIVVASQVFIIFASITEYREVKHQQKYLGTRIVFNSDTFLPDSTHAFTSNMDSYYIGKTNNYIFIYRSKENTTSVYPMSSVLQIDLKTKRLVEKGWFAKLAD